MDFEKDSTHVVIKFNKKAANGKESIDLVPITWIYTDNGKLYCKYPDKKDYKRMEKLSKTSSEPGALWKGFEISAVKEARKFII